MELWKGRHRSRVRIESPERDPHVHGQWILTKVPRRFIGERAVSQQSLVGQLGSKNNWVSYARTHAPQPTPCTVYKINSEWIMQIPKFRFKTMKLLENTGGRFHDLGINKDFLDTKSTIRKREGFQTSLKCRSSLLPRILLRHWKDKPQCGREHLQNVCLRKDLYAEYMKNS